jgi:hypothetical protein
MMNYSAIRTEEVMRQVKGDYRSGQALFNGLPGPAANAVAGTLFDPFHKMLSRDQVTDWIDNHLIFSDAGEVIGVFDNNKLLWGEDPPPDMAVPAKVDA